MNAWFSRPQDGKAGARGSKPDSSGSGAGPRNANGSRLGTPAEAGWALRQRAMMVREQLQPRGITDRRVLSVMTNVPRHLFVPPDMRRQAYEDEALGIGLGQTISQPFMVAVMSQALGLAGGERVLEIGTGSGYQTAILAELVRGPPPFSEAEKGDRPRAGHVYTVERVAELGESARRALGELGYDNISFRVGDGSLGWPENAPYDAVLLTAGAPTVPGPLIEQLAPGGRFVGPTGPADVQMLVKWAKTGQGEILKQDLLECRFVRLVGSAGWKP